MIDDVLFEVYNEGQVTRFDGVKSVVIKMTEGQHDLVVVSLSNPLDAVFEKVLGVSARFQWKANSVLRDIVGYLDTTSPHHSRTKDTVPDPSLLYMLAASYSMRDSTHRVWSDALPFTIARDVVWRYQFGLEMDSYFSALPFMSQSGGESDWRFLRRLAEEIGFSLVADGTTIRIVDPRREEQRSQIGETMLLTLPSATNQVTNVESFTLRTTDTGVGGEMLTGRTMRGRTTDGYEFTYSSEYALAPGTKATMVRPSERHYLSLADAMKDAERIARLSRWGSTAVLETQGDPRYRPGRCVQLVDTQGPHSGFWYVVEARHDMVPATQDYRCAITICRETASVNRRLLSAPLQPPERAPVARLTSMGSWQSSRQWLKST